MTYVLFACGVIMLLFVLSQLLSSDKVPAHYYMAFVCFCLGYQLMYFWAAEAGFLVRLPALIGSNISVMFLTAPAFYLASLSIMRGGANPARGSLAYFAAPLLFAIAFEVYRAATDPGLPRGGGSVPGFFEYPRLLLAAIGAFVATIVLLLISAYRFKKAGKIRKKGAFRIQVIFLQAYLAESLLALIACALMSERLLVAAVAAIGLTAAGFTLTCTGVVFFSRKGPSFVSGKAAAEREWDDSADRLSASIERLMEESAPYLDSDLTLDKLARLLRADPKRLSYFFNACLGTTFRSYINDRRLAAACRALLENPDATILDTAFASGFNSKTSFNTLFIKAYGMSPREYRSARGEAGKSGPDGEDVPRTGAGPRR
jgi:AraC-like DNA-binding protein